MKFTNKLSEKGVKRIPGAEPIHKFFHKRLEPKGIIQISVDKHKMFVNTQDKVITKSLIIDGVWEQFETDLFHKIIKPGDVVVDIGANIGYYTLIAADLVGKEGRVYAFEPEESNYTLLVKNIEANGYKNVITTKKGVSDKEGTVRLYLDQVNLGAPSFSEKNIFIEKGTHIDIETITLDEFFDTNEKDEKLNFLKIDAEGAEGLIVKGALEILRKHDLKIFMEFWPYGQRNIGTNPLVLLNTLAELGYKMKLIDEKKQLLRSIDIEEVMEICERSEKRIGHVNLLFYK